MNIKEKIGHEQIQGKSVSKPKRQKKSDPGREDGGPSTRSKTAQENSEIKKTYADILKAPATKNGHGKVIKAHEIKEFVNSQQQQAVSINVISTRKATANRTKAVIKRKCQHRNTQVKKFHWSETIGATLALIGNWTNLDYQGKLKRWSNLFGCKIEENSWNHSTNKKGILC